ncbi:hypothetical protein HU200_003386 [Digitaria exilis]|uniref:Cytochrome P450 n=1 Tax=Digitaria exilis TaxID=1010633 RepID=A0A835FVG0_9POAL|nr:hypothetical protein HU200_003386 [Digitaria exilis]
MSRQPCTLRGRDGEWRRWPRRRGGEVDVVHMAVRVAASPLLWWWLFGVLRWSLLKRGDAGRRRRGGFTSSSSISIRTCPASVTRHSQKAMEPAPTTMAMVSVLISFVLLVLSFVVPLRRRQKPLNLPAGPKGWPVIGSLHLLAGSLPPHRALAALASRHGAPLMHLKLGSFHVVVASSAGTARLVLKTHDLAFADRPPAAWGAIIAYGYKGIVQTPYGSYWRMARKLCATELFSPRLVDKFERARMAEMRALTRAVFVSGAGGRAAVTVREHLMSFTMRNILRMALGERWSSSYGSAEGEAFRRSLEEGFAVSGTVSNVGEWVPWLAWLDLQGLVGRMKRVHVEFDRFNEMVLDEHLKDHRRRRAVASDDAAARDLVDVLVQLAEEDDGGQYDQPPDTSTRLTRDGIKAIFQDIISGGTETTDLPDLAYIDAVLKETMRLHPVGPLLIPHHAREHTVVAGGYDIPAGARVLVNAWAVGRDPASWPESPEAFRPERFLAGGSAEGVDVRGAHFQLVPFGAGRRMCPAYNLAMKEMSATLANLVHGFSWRLPEGMAAEDVSLEEAMGLSVSLKEPVVAIAEPRLPVHLYAAVE